MFPLFRPSFTKFGRSFKCINMHVDDKNIGTCVQNNKDANHGGTFRIIWISSFILWMRKLRLSVVQCTFVLGISLNLILLQNEELISGRGPRGLCDMNEISEKQVLQCLNDNSTLPANGNMYLSKSYCIWEAVFKTLDTYLMEILQ